MPTILRVAGCEFYFYSHEPNEPPHVHVEYNDGEAKIWLEPIAVARMRGIRAHELTRIIAIVRANQPMLLERWHGHFGTRR